MATREVLPHGPTKNRSEPHTVASILAGKKPTPEQIPTGKAGILWMDLCDPEWSTAVADTAPADVFWLGITLATTRGIWHSFYGRKASTWLMERAPIALSLHRPHIGALRQLFDGRFRQEHGRRWSAALLRCVDGLVLFENPDADVPLPFGVLRELVGLEGHAPDHSFYRFEASDFDGVRRRLEDVERRLAFYAT